MASFARPSSATKEVTLTVSDGTFLQVTAQQDAADPANTLVLQALTRDPRSGAWRRQAFATAQGGGGRKASSSRHTMVELGRLVVGRALLAEALGGRVLAQGEVFRCSHLRVKGPSARLEVVGARDARPALETVDRVEASADQRLLLRVRRPLGGAGWVGWLATPVRVEEEGGGGYEAAAIVSAGGVEIRSLLLLVGQQGGEGGGESCDVPPDLFPNAVVSCASLRLAVAEEGRPTLAGEAATSVRATTVLGVSYASEGQNYESRRLELDEGVFFKLVRRTGTGAGVEWEVAVCRVEADGLSPGAFGWCPRRVPHRLDVLRVYETTLVDALCFSASAAASAAAGTASSSGRGPVTLVLGRDGSAPVLERHAGTADAAAEVSEEEAEEAQWLAEERARKVMAAKLTRTTCFRCTDVQVVFLRGSLTSCGGGGAEGAVALLPRCYASGFRDATLSDDHLKQPAATNKPLGSEQMWTIVESEMQKVTQLWTRTGGPLKYYDSVSAMSELCERVRKTVSELPGGQGGSCQFFSQSIHIMFEYLTTTALVLENSRSPLLQNRAFQTVCSEKNMTTARSVLLRRARALAREVDRRLDNAARRRLCDGKKRFREYLPSEKSAGHAPADPDVFVKDTCRGDACPTPARRQNLVRETMLCRECSLVGDEVYDDWATTLPPPSAALQQEPQQQQPDTPSSSQPAAAAAAARSPSPPPQRKSLYELFPDKRQLLVQAEFVLGQYKIDRDNFAQRELAVIADIAKLQEAGQHDGADTVTEALWVLRDYQADDAPFVGAPPPASAANINDVFAGCGFTVKKKKKKGKM